MKKLAIIHTHPVQYNSPLFKKIAEDTGINLKVFYTWSQAKDGFFDPKFGREIKWDIPLLEGYEYEFVENAAKNPGSSGFFGVVNPDLIKKIRQFSPDAILVYGWNHYSHLRAMQYFHNKIEVLFRGDSTLLDEQPGIKTLLRRVILKFVYSFVDYALYVGTANKEYFIKHGLKEEQLFFAPHAIENERFEDKDGNYTQQAEQWKKQLKIDQNETVFLFAGKLEPKKNPLLLLRAFKKLNKPQTKLIFIGNGQLENQLKSEAQGDDRIIFLPFQNQSKMPVVYRLADVFVLPSAYNETWGLAVNEAMASARPVIVSNKVGCAYDLVKDGENGYIIKSGDIDDLARKMSFFEKENSKKAGQNSLRIIQEWNYDKTTDAIKTILKHSKK